MPHDKKRTFYARGTAGRFGTGPTAGLVPGHLAHASALAEDSSQGAFDGQSRRCGSRASFCDHALDDAYVLSAAVTAAYEAACQCGADGGELLARAGLRPERLEDADLLLPYAEGIALWHAILEVLPRAHVGLVMGRLITLQRSGILGHAIAHLDTLGDALSFLQRHQGLADNTSYMALERHADVAVLKLEVHPVLDHLAQPVEGMAAGVHLVAQALSGHQLPIVRVAFAHGSQLAAEPYRDVFGIDPLFGQPRNALVYPAWTLDLPVRNAQRSLARYLVAYATDRLAHLVLPRPGLTARVRSWIADSLDAHQAPHQDEAAEAMGMSTRQLQRQLAAEHTAFRDLADELRQRRAETLLRDSDTSVEGVAHELGYGDPRSFYRACRRWTGRSPKDLRRHFRDDCLRQEHPAD